jgi:hypothetical protein
MPRTKIHFDDDVVIYRSAEDGGWVAHSLRTDQIGAGDRIVDALAELIRAVHGLLHLAEEDETIAYLREAPAEVQDLAADANVLPLEIFEVAHKMATGTWPSYLKVDVTPEGTDQRPFKTRVPEGAGA